MSDLNIEMKQKQKKLPDKIEGRFHNHEIKFHVENKNCSGHYLYTLWKYFKCNDCKGEDKEGLDESNMVHCCCHAGKKGIMLNGENVNKYEQMSEDEKYYLWRLQCHTLIFPEDGTSIDMYDMTKNGITNYTEENQYSAAFYPH